MLRLILIGALLAGCGQPAATPDSAEGGMGLPRKLDGEQYAGPRQPIRSHMTVASNGCVQLAVDGAELLAIWPRGSCLSSPVRLPDGTELSDGSAVKGVSTVMAAAALPGARTAAGP